MLHVRVAGSSAQGWTSFRQQVTGGGTHGRARAESGSDVGVGQQVRISAEWPWATYLCSSCLCHLMDKNGESRNIDT